MCPLHLHARFMPAGGTRAPLGVGFIGELPAPFLLCPGPQSQGLTVTWAGGLGPAPRQPGEHPAAGWPATCQGLVGIHHGSAPAWPFPMVLGACGALCPAHSCARFRQSSLLGLYGMLQSR